MTLFTISSPSRRRARGFCSTDGRASKGTCTASSSWPSACWALTIASSRANSVSGTSSWAEASSNWSAAPALTMASTDWTCRRCVSSRPSICRNCSCEAARAASARSISPMTWAWSARNVAAASARLASASAIGPWLRLSTGRVGPHAKPPLVHALIVLVAGAQANVRILFGDFELQGRLAGGIVGQRRQDVGPAVQGPPRGPPMRTPSSRLAIGRS